MKSPVLGSAPSSSSGAVFGEILRQSDRERGVAYLQQTRDGVVASITGLSEAQMKFKAAAGRWSVVETLEHIALVEDLIFQNLTNKIMQAPPAAGDRDVAEIDAMVMAMVPDRSRTFNAPQSLVPTGCCTPVESLVRFQKSRAKTIEFLQSTPNLREHSAESRALQQPLDAYQWVLFMAAHSERHTKQILEVKADPAFPKN